MRLSPLSLSILALLGGALTPSAHAASTYTYTTFDVPGSSSTHVYDINDRGQIAGFYSEDPAFVGAGAVPKSRYFVSGDGVYSAYDVPGTHGFSSQHINASGQVAGTYDDASLISQGFLYSGGVVTPLSVPGGSTDVADINAGGQVVGRSQSASSIQGFIYAGGILSPLNFPGTVNTAANGINDGGQIVGVYGTLSSAHGFLYSGGVFATLDVPGATRTVAYDINNGGEIVGAYGDGSVTRGYVYSSGVFNSFSLPDIGAGFLSLEINDRGQVAGSYLDAAHNAHSFSYDGATLALLNVPGATQTFANGINGNGQIAGYYTDADGADHGFIASPVPIPGAIWLFGSALAGFGFVRRKAL
ncbi:hypothetical protein [Methylococcus sp. EFPC2]|uniref:hypothetical protein n=1 Tax=Methylococcus sp. EFPC2 TaxID=2812648 RepID=UPI001968350F|nr:hypothetical protein [Methylococcus sp. EFPC2]QSA96033.1 hypothetical protein JWZ97_12390 [Methylococcus sp. EFPC2]